MVTQKQTMKRILHQISFYTKVIRFKFIKALQWRTEMVLWILLDIFPFIILLFIWQSIFAFSLVQNTSLSELTIFYFMVIVVQGLTSTHFEEYRPEEIRLGKIDFFLIKPYNYLQEIILNDLAGKLLYIIAFAPIVTLLGFALWRLELSTLPNLTGVHLFVLLCLLLLAYLMQLCFSILITLSAFWFDEASGLTHFKWLFISLFSGTLIPVALMPEWLQAVTNFFPLKFLFAVPIKLLQEQVLPTQGDWGLLLCTIIALLFGIFFVWKRGVQKYCSAGG